MKNEHFIPGHDSISGMLVACPSVGFSPRCGGLGAGAVGGAAFPPESALPCWQLVWAPSSLLSLPLPLIPC